MKINFWIPLLLSIIILGSCSTKRKENKPPNIVFIFSDDHGYQAVSAYGHPIGRLAPTPNIDRLAKEGMIFNKAFVANSLCGPSRACVITGKHSHMNGFKNNGDRFDPDQPTFPKMLHKAGYQTALIGKWHLKSKPQGFDYWNILPGQGQYYNPDFIRQSGDTARIEGYVTDIITDFALDWLKKRDDTKPFLLMYQHKAPHREWLPAGPYLDLYHHTTFPMPDNFYDDHAHMGTAARDAEMLVTKHMALSSDLKLDPKIVKEAGHKPFIKWYFNSYYNHMKRFTPEQRKRWNEVYGPINEEFRKNQPTGKAFYEWKFQRYMQDYLACIRSVDDGIGKILDYLKDKGLEENTIVVYTSDQGFYLGEHGWFDKRFMYEESFRTPMLVRFPGVVQPGSQSDMMVQNIDWAPTFLELAGLPIPEDIQGISMVPVLKGEHPANWRKSLYYHYYEYPSIHMVKRHYGIRTDRYTLIHFYYDIDEWELYDLEKDPSEMNNVIDEPTYQEVRKTLTQQLDSLIVAYKDPLDDAPAK